MRLRLQHGPYIGSNTDAGCASVSTSRKKVERDGLCFVCLC